MSTPWYPPTAYCACLIGIPGPRAARGRQERRRSPARQASISTWDTHRTRLSDPLGGNILRTLDGLPGPARAVVPARLAGGRPVLVSGGEDGRLYVHDLNTGDRTRRQAAGAGPIRSLVTVSLPDGSTRAVAAGHGHRAVVWDPDEGTLTRLDSSMVLLWCADLLAPVSG